MDLYLDISKPFDQVSHYCLIVKMKNLGISKKVISTGRYFWQNYQSKNWFVQSAEAVEYTDCFSAEE